MSKPKIYISGAISGLPKHEYESRFKMAEQNLLELGYETVNPCTLNHGAAATWEDFMLNDIKALFGCTAIYMLSNWKNSHGARIEHSIAVERSMVILYQPTNATYQLSSVI